MIEIDGSFGEGGGQILRTSLTLSAITGIPFRIYNIRAKRPKPGLQMQHLTAVRVVKTLCNAQVRGDNLGSLEIEFIPGKVVENGEFYFNVGTAGSITLILQTVIPIILNKKIKIRIRGGTDVPKAPTIDYIRLIFLQILSRIGIKGKIELIKRGHYPEGGGEIVAYDFAGEGDTFSMLDLGRIERVIGISHVSSLPEHIAIRQAEAAKRILSKLSVPISIDIDIRTNEISKGSGIALAIIGENSIMGSDALGEKGKRAEEVGEESAKKLLEDYNSKAAVDRYMSDMLMIYASLFGGEYSGAELTSHAFTNYQIIKMFLKSDISVYGKKPFKFVAKKPKNINI
jgi:RNA 3'-terminal phosphate cyclase (ATP)